MDQNCYRATKYTKQKHSDMNQRSFALLSNLEGMTHRKMWIFTCKCSLQELNPCRRLEPRSTLTSLALILQALVELEKAFESYHLHVQKHERSTLI